MKPVELSELKISSCVNYVLWVLRELLIKSACEKMPMRKYHISLLRHLLYSALAC